MKGYEPRTSPLTLCGTPGGFPAASRDTLSPSLVTVLEDALAATLRQQLEIPGWLCCRLAALYRSTARYDDEVHLLERCRSSQESEDARTRYDARLSKARTVAERKRRRESGALASVRASMNRPRSRRGGCETQTPGPDLSSGTLEALARVRSTPPGQLNDVLALVCADAHANDVPIEAVIASLRDAHGGETGMPDSRLDRAMLVLLALYYRGES